MLRPRVKICCISSLEEASLAIAHGADALGLVSEMPSGPGVIAEDLIALIAARVPPAVASFLLTCQHDAHVIIAQQRRTILCNAASARVHLWNLGSPMFVARKLLISTSELQTLNWRLLF